MIWTNLAFGPRYMGLNLDIVGLESRQKWIRVSIKFLFFGWATIWAADCAQSGGAKPDPQAWLGGFRQGIKNLFIKRARFGPARQVQLWKNPAWTQPIAIRKEFLSHKKLW